MFIIYAIVVILLLCALFISIIILICWEIHRDLTIAHTEHWDYGSFDAFRRLYENKKLKAKDLKEQIIKFDDKGMVLTYGSYLKYLIFLWKKKHPNKREKGIWK